MLDNLRILQVNLNKSAQAIESALQLVVELVIVKKPKLIPARQSSLDYLDTHSINYPSFTQILPLLQDYSIRPRVLVYSARTTQAQVTILADTNTQGNTTIERKLLSTSILPSAILLGDFNINHL
ncbi:uncharacterized protein M421DRAFT_79047 [Didymella exigua CBS 183.55]|uniref:Uncharacterized protein n=1 Tax=Didymella exigua CBS 183.55 TaxID=1150837 RepID=A0A6A5R8U8_9PLEO|nr:uncharacterized protein M421DRAFT_79047 [Didymella exigua CBS 183.55]KAF1922237.1 hypothetical protein M421DRAFT_79047 [Didymella exigua CBS 183.55]